MVQVLDRKKVMLCIVILGFLLIPLFPSVAFAAPTQSASFNSEATLDGYICKWGRPYPTTQYTDVSTSSEMLIVGQWKEKDGTQPGYMYGVERTYLSFDTSSIPDNAIIRSTKLRIETMYDYSTTDFTMEVRGGSQPIYGSSLGATDWGCGTTVLATWNTVNYPGNNQYIEFTIPTGQVNRAGRTQFELKSNREGTQPTNYEEVIFYSGDTIGKPYLQVTYTRAPYAVLIAGGLDAAHNYARYWNDLMFMYDALTNLYQYTATNVYVLYANGSPPTSANCNDSTHAVTHANVIDFSATTANLASVFSTLSTVMTSDDFLFVYSTDHGANSDGHSYLVLWGATLRDDTFAGSTYLGRVTNYYRETVLMEQCYSGGFIDDLANAKRVIITACTATQVSYACDTEGYYDEFVYYWTSAVFWHTPGGTHVNADTNGDGLISMLEAYGYAYVNDSFVPLETPQGSGNIAATTYLLSP